MRLRYCKEKAYWYNPDTMEIDGQEGQFHEQPQRQSSCFIMSDIEPYKSPLGTGMITSRTERREELKRNGLREVDPSEFKAQYKNERFMNKHGIKGE